MVRSKDFDGKSGRSRRAFRACLQSSEIGIDSLPGGRGDPYLREEERSISNAHLFFREEPVEVPVETKLVELFINLKIKVKGLQVLF
jgi:hypothetical protein